MEICAALIVEDEPFVRLHLADTLEASGWQVMEADCGERAVALLDKGMEKLDLIVTDIRLSGALTGWDVAETFRKAWPSVGVVYASGNLPLPDRQVPGSRFLSKPIAVDELLAAAAEACSPPA